MYAKVRLWILGMLCIVATVCLVIDAYAEYSWMDYVWAAIIFAVAGDVLIDKTITEKSSKKKFWAVAAIGYIVGIVLLSCLLFIRIFS